MWEVRLFKRIVNCTKGIMPVSMFVIYRTIFIVFGSHKWASENSAKLDFPCCQLTFSPRLKQGDSCISHHCAATEVVASYTMSDRRYFPCVPRYGMY